MEEELELELEEPEWELSWTPIASFEAGLPWLMFSVLRDMPVVVRRRLVDAVVDVHLVHVLRDTLTFVEPLLDVVVGGDVVVYVLDGWHVLSILDGLHTVPLGVSLLTGS